MVSTDDFIKCNICPRGCGTDRRIATGFCGCPSTLYAARAGLHFYEEPFLSGERGSGTVFFSGCNLKCIYCQNHDISLKNAFGIEITTERLAEIFFELREKGAHNINLVTGTPYIPLIAKALENAKPELSIPVIWNSSAYENIDALKMLDGLVDIWLPDFKTMTPQLALKYMSAPDYPEKAFEAIKWMVESTGSAEFYDSKNDVNCTGPQEDIYDDSVFLSENMLMKKGVCVRHLVIPGQVEDSKKVLEKLYNEFGDEIWISLMSQYTPMRSDFEYPELNRKLTEEEYEEIVDFAIDLGIEQCMIQEDECADESFIPAFDGAGIIK